MVVLAFDPSTREVGAGGLCKFDTFGSMLLQNKFQNSQVYYTEKTCLEKTKKQTKQVIVKAV